MKPFTFASGPDAHDPAGPVARGGPPVDEDRLDEAGRFRLGRLSDSRERPANLRTIRALCQNAWLGDNTSLCRVLGRFMLLVDTRDRKLAPHLLMNGIWELHVTECLARLVQPGMTIVDAGANYGYFALLTAGLTGPEGRVLAIEANPAVADLLESSLELNGLRGRTKVHRVALGDATGGVLPFVVDPRRPMNAHVLRPHEKRAGLAAGLTVVETPVTRLDDLIAPGERVDVMKVDLEAAEEAFWSGARRVLTENPGIQVLLEVRAGRYRDAAGFFQRLKDDGFILRVLRRRGVIETVPMDELLAAPGDDMLYLTRQLELPARFTEGRGG